MKPTSPSKTPNAERSAFNAQSTHRALLLLFLLLLVFYFTSTLYAQVGLDNPAGVSGIFNGQAGGCGYDPYTANATRSITDIAIAGGVGEYPLALVRTANSRTPSTTEVFGFAGGWNHNYNWILEDSPASTSPQPKRYTVDFPDGRVEKFRAVTWDTNYYRVRPGPDTPTQGTSSGVRERFLPIANGYCYLILPDGGKVKFSAQQHQFQQGGNTYYYYTYRARAIIDPYGLTTTLTYETTPNTRVRLLKVTEPAGRYLQFYYTGDNSLRIRQVTASDGRNVNYYYQYCNGCRLYLVRYYNNQAWDAHYQYTGSNIGGELPPLLWTADDPMYSGPMKRIAYEYKPPTPRNPDNTAAVYGQILRERYYDGTNVGAAVSTLTVGSPNNNRVYRTETRGDNKTRVFIYNGAGPGYLAWASDFTDRYASQSYDQTTKYITAVMDRRGNTTDYTPYTLTGNVNVVTYPLTQGDTPGQQTRPTVRYQYGWANCPDPNNRDANNPYYLYSVTDEGNHVTTFTRDANKRVTRIDYPDGGYETFGYNGFGQMLTHRLKTGGTETFAYDGLYRLQYYSDAYHNNANNPSIQYFYEGHGWVNGVFVFDPVGHPTNWTYNERGQVLVTTLPPDPFDGNQRNTITNAYNPDGTLQSRTNELDYTTSYTYDDYRRLKSVFLPGRGTTNFYYGATASDNVDDYKLTDSNVTWVKLPSGKKTKIVYDENRRKSSVTVGSGSGDDATTSYAYDAVGNLTTITNPLNHNNVSTLYDQRNRSYSISVGGQTTTTTYDTAGRQKTITRPNGQLITNNTFDAMNRITQQTATQTPDPNAVSKFAYYTTSDGPTAPVGLLKTFKDPRISGTSYEYKYEYDLMGRKKKLTYPPDPLNVQRTEQWSYDDAGRLGTFKNRAGNVQTFTYDALNRMTRSDWNDSTPDVTFTYDAASRLTGINNANAQIARIYWGDGLLLAEAELITGGASKVVQYDYDVDGNRASITYPEPEYIFDYTYTGRNQLETVGPWATYEYDTRGNLTFRTLANGTASSYSYDALDRVYHIAHALHGTGRRFDYGYDNVGNRKWTKRDQANGDVFGYDLADQATVAKLNILNPDTTAAGNPTIAYDANGNRTTFRPYGPTDTYYIDNNSLNQYNRRNNINAAYDYKGNLTTGFDGSGYQYDAQNRLTQATKNGVTMTFKYDGLNRQVSRSVTGQPTVYNVWDGWNLIEEYQSGGATTALYLYGATGLILGAANGQINYYYQDGSGSTSHFTDADGNLLEWYRYDLQGTPFIYDPNDNQLPTNNSAFGVRHLFTGQQWYSDIGLYDLRNRFYSPDIGRFLQPDPIGFRGDRTNLYRYCGNNPVTRSDPTGETVYIAQKSVGPFNHAYLIISPSNLASFPGAVYVTASGELTISGQPSGVLGSGYLNGGTETINSDIYSPRNDMTLVQPPAGLSDAAFDYSVYDAATSYPNNTYEYVAIPELSPVGGYNSNGYLVRVLNGAGVNGKQIVDSLPGWQPGSGYPPGGGSWSYQNDKGEIVVVGTDPHSPWGNLPTTPTTNWAGGRAGQPFGGSSWRISFGVNLPSSIFGADNWYSGLDPIANVGSTYGEGFRGMYNFP